MILLTAMEHMREEADEKEEVSIQIPSSGKADTEEMTAKIAVWQELNSGNWSNRIKTFGKKKVKFKKILGGGIFCYEFPFQRGRLCLEPSYLLD